MRFPSDFVIADRSEAEEICAAKMLDERYEWLEATSIDPVQLAALRAAVLDQPFDPAQPLPESLMTALAIKSAFGPAVYEVPVELVEKLATLGVAGQRGVIARWVASQQDIRTEGAEWFVPKLAKLCRRARARGKWVLLRMMAC